VASHRLQQQSQQTAEWRDSLARVHELEQLALQLRPCGEVRRVAALRLGALIDWEYPAPTLSAAALEQGARRQAAVGEMLLHLLESFHDLERICLQCWPLALQLEQASKNEL
jgi:hypothetical protein